MGGAGGRDSHGELTGRSPPPLPEWDMALRSPHPRGLILGTLLLASLVGALPGCVSGPILDASVSGFLLDGPWLGVETLQAVPGAALMARDPDGIVLSEGEESTSTRGFYFLRFLPAWQDLDVLVDGENLVPGLIPGRTVRGDLQVDIGVLHSVSTTWFEQAMSDLEDEGGLAHELDPDLEEGGLLLLSWRGDPELDRALVDLDAALKRAEVTRKAKNDALAAYDATFLRVARVAESLFHFAGLHERALRVRPSTLRPGRRLADEGAEPESGDTAARRATIARANRFAVATGNVRDFEECGLRILNPFESEA